MVQLYIFGSQPLFLSNRPSKPLLKRGHNTVPSPEERVYLVKLCFGFSKCHSTTPGEAEATYALLQIKNLVNAVLTGNVDAMIFRSITTMRIITYEFS